MPWSAYRLAENVSRWMILSVRRGTNLRMMRGVSGDLGGLVREIKGKVGRTVWERGRRSLVWGTMRMAGDEARDESHGGAWRYPIY